MRTLLHLSVRFALALVGAIGLAVGAANGSDLTFTYNSAADVPVSAGSYAASGSATLALNFTPATGTTLTVVNNTGLEFISGTFGNLAQGQEVVLSYQGVNYRFVANYYGGTGNDLVLQWANVRAMGWGENGSGQLGNNSTTDGLVPVPVVPSGVLAGKTILTVAAGGYHSLALCSDGTLAAWGLNESGTLGNNSTVSSLVPVAVVRNGALAGKTVVAVSAGYVHSLALCSDGTVAAWGWNGYGQLGNSTTTDSLVPVAVFQSGILAGKSVIGVSAGTYHSLAVCSDGTMVAWGKGGQLGNNSTTDSLVPVAVFRNGVLAGKTVIAVSAGNFQSAALCSDGTPVTWGDNVYGQLGNNSNVESLVPVAVNQTGLLAGKTVTALSMSASHALALCSDGNVAAWGWNGYGQLGNNSTTDSSVPVAVLRSGVLAGRKVVAVSAGVGTGLAICSDGAAVTWGYGGNGQSGDGSMTDKLVPVAVATSGLTIGERFVMGDNSRSYGHVMALVASPPPPPSVTTFAAAGVSATGATLNGTVNANNSSTAVSFEYGTTTTYGKTASAVPAQVTGNNTTAVQTTLTGLAPGTTCHFRVSGTSANGTSNGTDQAFITPGTVTFNTPTDVPATADGFSASGAVNFAIKFLPPVGTNLTVVNNTGQGFINGTFSNLAQGQMVTLSYNGLPYRFLVSYFGGTGNDMVLQWANVRLMSWGNNFNGQLASSGALGFSAVPVVVSQTTALANKTVTAVATGYGHSLALCSDGKLTAWGWNQNGQLGNNTTSSTSLPVSVIQTGVLTGKTIVAVSAGGLHSIALCSDGTLAAWGRNGTGQLGNNSTTDSKVPVAVLRNGILAGKTVVAVHAGYHHNLALCSDGTLAAWGWNADGQLGINNKIDSLVPVAVDQSGTLAGRSIIALAAGLGHSLVLCSDGTLAAWGVNSYGELGNNSTTSSLVPVAVNRSGVLANKTVVGVAAGLSHSLARCSDGTFAAWGRNQNGQLGNTTTTYSSLPVAVPTVGALAGKIPVGLTAGDGHNLVLCSDGTLAAWGANFSGQLGMSSNGSDPVPIPMAVVKYGFAPGERFVLAKSGPSAAHNLALVASPEPVPASVTVNSGSDKSAEVNTPFAIPLSVIVRDSGLWPMAGVTVTFGTPGSGAGGSFAGGVNTVVTDASGIGTAPVFTANTVAGGPYIVDASVSGAPLARFYLYNTPSAATQLVISAPADATAGVALGITITARDRFDNRATGFSHTVHFTSTDGGAALPADYTFLVKDAGVHQFPSGVKLFKAGQQTLTVTDTASPAVSGSGTIHVSAGPPARISSTSGTPQVAVVNTGFPLPLAATVRDAYANPISGIPVTFIAPDSGAGGGFGENNFITAITDSNGVANSPVFTANTVAGGPYPVTASAPGLPSVDFSLSNAPAQATHLVINAPVQATAGAAFGINVTARDQFDNKATGFSETIHFTSTDAAATLPAEYTFLGGDGGSHEFPGAVKLLKAGQQSLTVVDVANPSISGTGTVSVSAGAPVSIAATSGTPQVAKVATSFPLPLVATVRDAYGNPANGISVTFTAPAAGASAVFGVKRSIAAITNSNGVANSGIVKANAVNGSYIVTAMMPLAGTPAVFELGNGTVNPTSTLPATPPGGFPVAGQTGLFNVTVKVRNTTPFPINGFRLHVDFSSYRSTYPSLRLYNSSSPASSHDVYVDYPYPVAVGKVVSMKLSFYTNSRTFPNPFVPKLTVEMLKTSQVPDTNGRGVQPRIVTMKGGSVLLEFPSVPGRWYRVRYSPDTIHWLDCPVPLQAAGTRLQWIDSGPPFTDVRPSAAPSRFYVVKEINAP